MGRSVMLTKLLPIPPDSGGKLRSLALLRRLRDRGDVLLCAFDDPRADHDAIRDLGVEVVTHPRPTGMFTIAGGAFHTGSIGSGRFFSGELMQQLHAAVARSPIDNLVVEFLQMTPYARGIKARRRVLDLHNIESSLMLSYAAARRGPASWAARAEATALRRMERRAVGEFDVVVVVSETDRLRLPAGAASVLVCPNGFEERPALAPFNDPVVTFVATMSWPPNTDAATWLAKDIWPRVLAHHPGAWLQLVGRDPSPQVVALSGPTVEVTGTVDQIEPYLAKTSIVVAPLRMGGGSRLKILEALGYGRPVVATTVGAEGLEDLVGEGVVLADTASEFAKTVSNLLADPAEAQRIGRLGWQAIRSRYYWDTTLKPLLDQLDR